MNPFRVIQRKVAQTQMDILLGILRHTLTTAGGALVTNGYLSGGDLEAAVGAVITLIGIGLSVYVKRTKAVA